MKNVTDPIAQYFQTTKFTKKLQDALLVIFILLFWGMATGRIPVPDFASAHTVEASFSKSTKVQELLKQELQSDDMFIARFVFHNGVSSLNGTFSFIKYTMVESESAPYIVVNPTEWSQLPYSLDLNMIGELLKGNCYSSKIGLTHLLHGKYTRLNTNHVTMCPIFDPQNRLYGFVAVGTNSTPATFDRVREITARIQGLK